ncbi:MAG: DUF1800 domain-containing protein [Burkholderiales bacterium]|nr:DUF1800 domain-containing protein [Burkholderiales bacterium]
MKLVLLVVLVFSAVTARAELPPDAKALHVLNRLGFGPAPGDMRRIESMGIENYIQAQLDPESMPLPPKLAAQLDGLDTLHLDPVQLFGKYGPPLPARGEKIDPQAAKDSRRRAHVILEQAAQARLLRAMESPRQLQEVMVDFWFNHFNVFAEKGLDYLWIGAYEEEAIRPHVLGHFRDILGATARHPAMLFYLDNWLNTAPDSPGVHGQFEGLNENYAREIMELHTVSRGYTQQDVVTLAQILTGRGLRLGRFGGDAGDGFFFDRRRHDFSDKMFLGQKIKGRGEAEGEAALDLLAKSPDTARHISYELAQYFVSDQPDPVLVDKLARRFLDTDGNIRAVLDALFHSQQFWDEKNVGNKFKTPYEYVVSAVRASGEDVDNFRPLTGMLQQLGQPLYGCQTPDGYKNTQAAWLSPDSMMRRLNFATALGSGYLPLAAPGQRSEPVDPERLADTLGRQFSLRTSGAVDAAPRMLKPALILGSPEFMRR